MNCYLWTLVISAAVLIIEFIIYKCIEVRYFGARNYTKAQVKIWWLLLMLALFFVPIFNALAAVFLLPSLVLWDIAEFRLKDINKEENKSSILLHIAKFLNKNI